MGDPMMSIVPGPAADSWTWPFLFKTTGLAGLLLLACFVVGSVMLVRAILASRKAGLTDGERLSRVHPLLLVGLAGPLIGLLGAIHSMICTCKIIHLMSDPTIRDLAPGGAEALTSAAGGFLVALLFLPAYLILGARRTAATP